jgi:hypothetical protein
MVPDIMHQTSCVVSNRTNWSPGIPQTPRPGRSDTSKLNEQRGRRRGYSLQNRDLRRFGIEQS